MEKEDEAGVSVSPINEQERPSLLDIEPLSIRVPCVDMEFIKEPSIGMEFKTIEDAYTYYSEYAKCEGFETRKSSSEKSRIDGAIISKLFVCSKEGFREKKYSQRDDRVKRERIETRIGCKACLMIRRRKHGTDEAWEVTRFEILHNHDLAPVKTRFIHYQRKLNIVHQGVICRLDAAAIPPGKALNTFVEQAGGEEHVPILQQNKHTLHINERLKSLDSGGVKEAIKYCNGMRQRNPGFFYTFEVDDEGKVNKFFWTDARSRMAYDYFGDIVSLNTTYKNHDEFPFVIFSGCNHHRHTIFFGAGLLWDETEDSFVWLFNQWLEAMTGQPPITIITDLDATISKAIARVFSSSNHHLCMWHVSSEASKNLNHIISAHEHFRSEFDTCCRGSQTTIQFEERWRKLIDKYDDPWLQSLYELREKWIPVYTQQTFTAGMTTSQWSESVGALLSGSIGKRTTLHEFLVAYENALMDQYHQECEADFIAVRITPVLKGCIPMEKQVVSLYTRENFVIFQEELQASLAYICEEVESSAMFKTYNVKGYKSDAQTYIVTFNHVEKVITCTCLKFEAEGILCRHALKIFIMNNVLELPQHYILERWTRSMKSQLLYKRHGNKLQEDSNKSFTSRFNYLCRRALRCADEGAISIDTYESACQSLNRCLEEIFISKQNIMGIQGPQNEVAGDDSINEDDDCIDVDTSTGETKSSYTSIAGMKCTWERLKRPKIIYTCSLCGGKDHNKRMCPLSRGVSQFGSDYQANNGE